MRKQRSQPTAPKPAFEDVRRRMLNTRPDPHVAPKKKPAKAKRRK
jgi:hypothetical protein